MKRLVIKRLGFVIGLFFLALTSVMAVDDRDQPISIEADRVDVDDAKGVSVYRGNVILRQGSMELLADELTLATSQQRELATVTASGSPARFKQFNDPEAGEIRGHASVITYDVKEEYMTFVGGAYLWQCGDEVSGDQVEYFGQQALVKAQKAADGEGRVQVILQPREQGQAKRCSKQGTP